jgi:hypothetical protein
VCRYIVDPQSEGVLLPPKGPEANVHQEKYKISSHVQAFMRQFAQWRSEKQFEAVGPWRLIARANSKLEVHCRQNDMTGGLMFQAMYILAPDSPVASVSCALPSPKSLAIGFAPPRHTSVSAGTLATKSKAADKSKSGEKVLCSYCGKMFGKQGIRNHIAKCAEQVKGWDQHKYEAVDGHEDSDDDFDDLDILNSGHQGNKKTTFRTQPSPSITLSAAGDAPKTPQQELAATEKELKALKKEHKALQQLAKPVIQSSSGSSSSDDSSSSNSSPQKKKKSQQKKKSGRSAAELRAKAAEAAAAAEAAEAAAAAAAAAGKRKKNKNKKKEKKDKKDKKEKKKDEDSSCSEDAAAAAGKRKKKHNKKKEKKEKKEEKKDEDSSCSDDSSSDGSSDSPASSSDGSDGNGHRRRKRQRRKQALSANPRNANRKSQKRRSEEAQGWYIQLRTNQAILEERARTNRRMHQLVHNHLRNWLSDFTIGCAGTRGPRCRQSC